MIFRILFILFAAACVAGVHVAAGQIADSFEDIEADLTISGTTTLVDGNHDYRIEKLHNGQWEGELVFGTGIVPLPKPDQKFVGLRVGID